jgi:hypothetical protein
VATAVGRSVVAPSLEAGVLKPLTTWSAQEPSSLPAQPAQELPTW